MKRGSNSVTRQLEHYVFGCKLQLPDGRDESILAIRRSIWMVFREPIGRSAKDRNATTHKAQDVAKRCRKRPTLQRVDRAVPRTEEAGKVEGVAPTASGASRLVVGGSAMQHHAVRVQAGRNCVGWCNMSLSLWLNCMSGSSGCRHEWE
jgi:hypothetical protein